MPLPLVDIGVAWQCLVLNIAKVQLLVSFVQLVVLTHRVYSLSDSIFLITMLSLLIAIGAIESGGVADNGTFFANTYCHDVAEGSCSNVTFTESLAATALSEVGARQVATGSNTISSIQYAYSVCCNTVPTLP